MKKYLFYIDSMQMGGAQRVMNNLIDFFVEKGNEVGLINDIKPSLSEPEYEINTLVKRYYLDGESTSRLRKNLVRIKHLRTIIKQERPDCVISFLGPPNIRLLLATIGISTKKYVSVRNDPYREYGSGIKRIISKCLFLLADGCIFQTKDARDYFYPKTKKKSRIILNPVNEKFYSHCWKGTGNNIVLIGRLQAQKNPMLALNAFIKIADIYPNINLMFYGDEELSTQIQIRAQENGLGKRVKVMGKTSKVEEVLENALMYVLSSDYEGMPNALMEAMAVGTPAIATDCPCGGPHSLILNDEQGVLVPCGDLDCMVEAMKRLIDNKDLRQRISVGERKRAKSFSPVIILEQWNDYLK